MRLSHNLITAPVILLCYEELLRRIGCTNSAGFVATVRQELERARAAENVAWAGQIHACFTYRMHRLERVHEDLVAAVYALVQSRAQP